MFRILNTQDYGVNYITVKFTEVCRIMIYDLSGRLKYAMYDNTVKLNYSDNIKTIIWFYDKCHYGSIGLTHDKNE